MHKPLCGNDFGVLDEGDFPSAVHRMVLKKGVTELPTGSYQLLIKTRVSVHVLCS
jgi:hypothetical protein